MQKCLFSVLNEVIKQSLSKKFAPNSGWRFFTVILKFHRKLTCLVLILQQFYLPCCVYFVEMDYSVIHICSFSKKHPLAEKLCLFVG
jgi:hypothetical protein